VVVKDLNEGPNHIVHDGFKDACHFVPRLLKPPIVDYLSKIARRHFSFLVESKILQRRSKWM
jgi:hypothetical protein